MFGSEVLDVAIGLVFIFLTLSLVCSAVNELIESIVKNRARDLEAGIRELLTDPTGKGVVSEMYNHSLVNALFKGEYNPLKTHNLPTYIPSRTFALTLMDLVLPATATSKSGSYGAMQVGLAGAGVVEELRKAAVGFPNAELSRVMLSLIDSAAGDAARVRQNIETWYDSAMNRVSGWYKRRTHFILMAVSLLVAFGLNADTVALTRYLSTNKSVRELIVARAAKVTPPPAPDKEKHEGTPTDLMNNLSWLNSEGGLPLGWRALPNGGQDWTMKLFGLIITAFALSLGAPFWFDLLNRFMVVRSTVKPDEKSQDEPSKG